MNTAKVYHDSDGNECTIHQMVKREPAWAANRIQEGEAALEEVERLKGIMRNDILSPQSVMELCLGCVAARSRSA